MLTKHIVAHRNLPGGEVWKDLTRRQYLSRILNHEEALVRAFAMEGRGRESILGKGNSSTKYGVLRGKSPGAATLSLVPVTATSSSPTLPCLTLPRVHRDRLSLFKITCPSFPLCDTRDRSWAHSRLLQTPAPDACPEHLLRGGSVHLHWRLGRGSSRRDSCEDGPMMLRILDFSM